MYCSSVSRPYLLVVVGQVCHPVMGNKNGHESWLQIVHLSNLVLGLMKTLDCEAQSPLQEKVMF